MANKWLEQRVIGYAHQGGAFEAPASTFYAMDNAIKLGMTGLELDIHRSADGVLIVMHDESVDRTSSGEGRVSDLTWEELSALDNSYWFVPDSMEANSVGHPPKDYVYRGLAPENPEFGIARFSEILERYKDVYINVDIKQASPNSLPYETQVVDEIVAGGAIDRVMVASFRDSSLFAVRKYNSEISTSAGPGEVSEFYFALLNSFKSAVAVALAVPYVAFQIPHFYGEIELATKEFIDAAHAADKAVHVWTINDPAEIELLLERGADGIISDCPSVVSKVMPRK